jgi:hypothetical protein
MSQTEFDNQVDLLVGHEVRLAYTASIMRKQNDPEVASREEELMLLQNCIYTLRNYDVTSLLLTDNEIRIATELATQTILNWPR